MAVRAIADSTGLRVDAAKGGLSRRGVVVGVGGLLLLFAYATIEFVRPQVYFPSIAGAIRPALVLTILISIYWLRRYGPKEIVGDRLLVYCCLFAAFTSLWVPFAVNNYWALQMAINQWLVLTVATVPMSLMLVSSVRRRQYLTFWILMHAYLALFVIANGGRGPGGIMQDENDVAFAFCMVVPYPFFLAQRSGNRPRERVLWYGLTLLLLAGIIATHSRGGFLGLLCVTAYAIYLSRNRMRKILVLITLSLIALWFVPESYYQRISTISDTSDHSRVERLKSWRIAWNMFLDHPVFGVGPSNYGAHAPPYHMALPDYVLGEPLLGGRAAHSLYFTVLAETGLVGTTLFVLLFVGSFRRLRESERIAAPAASGGDDEAERAVLTARAAKASLIGYLATGTFISILYYPHLWYALGIVIALTRDVSHRYSEPAQLGNIERPRSTLRQTNGSRRPSGAAIQTRGANGR